MALDSGVMLVRKVSEILEVLSRGEASAAELARAIDEPRSSIYRILGSMRSEGLVESGRERGQFRLGVRLLSLGSAVASGFDERAFARPFMEQLHELTGETVFLCVPREDRAVCIERIDGKRVQSLALRLGGSLPLHAGASSRALLAGRSPDLWEKYIADNEPLEAFTALTPCDPDDLRRVLAEAASSGLAVSDQDVTLGISAFGAPITDYEGRTRAALSISGVRESILGPDSEAWQRGLLDAAAEISRAFGAEAGGRVDASTL